ncbi:MAG: EthD family reductase [Sideroxydans sp.]|nr:EthD family reductase [Sideroxydans sp.]
MVKISILYPNTGRFDMDYYLNTHMPRSIQLLSAGKGYRGVSVERGLGGAAPGSAPPFVALCHYLFDTADDFMAAFMPHAAELKGDMPNYTDIESVIQVSEVAINQYAT